MASMPRGEPRSVPDPDRAAYEAMVHRQKRINQQQELGRAARDHSGQRPAEVALGAVRNGYKRFVAKDASGNPLYPIGHPGLAESVVPIVGAGHEALADFQEGHPILGAANLGLAGVEATGLGTVASDVTKVGLRLGRSQTWDALRKVYGKEGLLEKFQHGHHIVHREDFPSWVPDRVVNNWLNIKPMANETVKGVEHTGPQVHRRMHGPAKVNGQMLPEFSFLQKAKYGTKPSTRVLIAAPIETAGRVGFHAATPDRRKK